MNNNEIPFNYDEFDEFNMDPNSDNKKSLNLGKTNSITDLKALKEREIGMKIGALAKTSTLSSILNKNPTSPSLKSLNIRYM